MAFLGINWDWSSFLNRKQPKKAPDNNDVGTGHGIIPPGRTSVANDTEYTIMSSIKGMTKMVTPTFRTELIPLIRDLYKVNPDMSIALQDMFKLSNTGHKVTFPNNTDEEAAAMTEHLQNATKNWTRYTAGIDGLVNKFIVQCLIGGAVSIEAVPNRKLNGLATILFIKPEEIIFERLNDGVYQPYQINKSASFMGEKNKNLGVPYIKLNNQTFKYVSMYNDTDEPYGVPPFLSALDSLKTQADMKTNLKQIMELMGLLGFLEVTMEKPDRLAGESNKAYENRLKRTLTALKQNIASGMKDGVVVGYNEDHEFKLNSTTKNLGGIDKVWALNQQSLANGLGTSGTIIGVNATNSEGGAGIVLSKMISQLRNIQMIVIHVLEFIYSLELRLAGFNNKGVKISFTTSTISDEMKIQQGLEVKIRNLTAMYAQGLISQDDFAREMNLVKPAMAKPRPIVLAPGAGVSSPDAAAKKQKREKGKDTSDRKVRDKVKVVPKRKDQKNT